MFKELDAIVLTTEIPLDHIWDVPPGSPLVENGNLRKGLQAGDVGSSETPSGERSPKMYASTSVFR